MSFGEQLQLLRRGHNLTQEDFAQELNVSRQAVSKWESSKGYPEIEKIIYICNQYGATMDELFAEMTSLYRLDQISNSGGLVTLGPLPTESVLLLIVLAVCWVIMGIYVLAQYIKKKKYEKNS